MAVALPEASVIVHRDSVDAGVSYADAAADVLVIDDQVDDDPLPGLDELLAALPERFLYDLGDVGKGSRSYAHV